MFPKGSESEKVEWIVDHVKEVLLPELKQHLLDMVFYAICAEFRHIFIHSEFKNYEHSIENGVTALKIPQKYRNLLNISLKDIKPVSDDYVQQDEVFRKVDKRMPEDLAKNTGKKRTLTYNAVLKAIEKVKSRDIDMVEAAGWIFKNIKWDIYFGGENWATICDAWINLYKAKDTNTIIIYIDRIYDLQHNTDTVFNKVSSYAMPTDIGTNYAWIKKALDFKAKIKLPYELYDNISPQMKQISRYVIKDSTGMTMEQWLPLKEIKAKEYAQYELDLKKAKWEDDILANPDLWAECPKKIRELLDEKKIIAEWNRLPIEIIILITNQDILDKIDTRKAVEWFMKEVQQRNYLIGNVSRSFAKLIPKRFLIDFYSKKIDDKGVNFGTLPEFLQNLLLPTTVDNWNSILTVHPEQISTVPETVIFRLSDGAKMAVNEFYSNVIEGKISSSINLYSISLVIKSIFTQQTKDKLTKRYENDIIKSPNSIMSLELEQIDQLDFDKILPSILVMMGKEDDIFQIMLLYPQVKEALSNPNYQNILIESFKSEVIKNPLHALNYSLNNIVFDNPALHDFIAKVFINAINNGAKWDFNLVVLLLPDIKDKIYEAVGYKHPNQENNNEPEV